MTARLGRLALCYGTRPQVVKASVLLDSLRADWEVISIDTGQHYDWELHGLQYEQLGISEPHLFLEVRSGGHADQTAAVVVRATEAIQRYRPDVVVVIGDTNSTLGCALAAAKERVYLVHVEAGLRSGDLHMAEEINRRVVDEISSLLCAPSRRSTDFLSARVSDTQTVRFTGDVARDVLERARRARDVPNEPWHQHGIDEPYVLLTLHRAELTAREDWLAEILTALGQLDMPVFFPSHPRTARVLDETGLMKRVPGNVIIHQPLGYLDMIAWTEGAAAVVTDSGGLQREAYWLGVPCVTLRAESEWTETLEEGANVLLPPNEASRLRDVIDAHVGRRGRWSGSAYGSGNAAESVREALSTAFG